MAYRITDKCTACGTCAMNCPVKAVAAAGGKYDIDQGMCLRCGLCAANCPSEAIAEEDD